MFLVFKRTVSFKISVLEPITDVSVEKQLHMISITHSYLEDGYEKPFDYPIIQNAFKSMSSHLCTKNSLVIVNLSLPHVVFWVRCGT